MSEEEKSQEPTLSECMDNIGKLFDKFVTEWNKLVALQKEQMASFERLIKGGRP